MNLPTSKLGDVSAITITTADLETSLSYYQHLGFTEVLRHDFPFPWIQISDGALLIMLRKDPVPYISLTYYVKDLNKIASELEQSGISFSQKSPETDIVKRYLFQSPDGLTIALVTYVDGFKQPPGPTMQQMQQSDFFNPDKYINKSCGLFGEFAHPVKDLEQSIAYWGKLGFTTLSKFEAPYPWAIISDGLAVIGLHQTGNFSYPVITYFAVDMKEKIEKLKNAGLTNFTESDGGNSVLTTPEQQKINLFKLGM